MTWFQQLLKRYQNHPSITKIINTISTHQSFSFQHVTIEEIQKEIINLNPTKASQDSDIPVRLIKANSDIYVQLFIMISIIT